MTPIEDGPGTEDANLLERAWSESRILITNDKEFGELVFRDRHQHAGIVLFRLENDLPAARVERLNTLLSEHADALHAAFVVVTDASFRFGRE